MIVKPHCLVMTKCILACFFSEVSIFLDAPNEEIVNVPAKKNSLKAETEDIVSIDNMFTA